MARTNILKIKYIQLFKQIYTY